MATSRGVEHYARSSETNNSPLDAIDAKINITSPYSHGTAAL